MRRSVQVMASRLFGAKPLPDPTLTYCHWSTQEPTSVKFQSKCKNSIHDNTFQMSSTKWRSFWPERNELKDLPKTWLNICIVNFRCWFHVAGVAFRSRLHHHALDSQCDRSGLWLFWYLSTRHHRETTRGEDGERWIWIHPAVYGSGAGNGRALGRYVDTDPYKIYHDITGPFCENPLFTRGFPLQMARNEAHWWFLGW